MEGSSWNFASSTWGDDVCEGGTNRSKRSNFAGSCTNEPSISDTSSGRLDVGGNDAGGRAMFSRRISDQSTTPVVRHKPIQTLLCLLV